MNPEEIGTDIYREARLSPWEPVRRGSVEIAHRLGLGIFELPHAKAEVSLARWRGRSNVVLRSGVRPERANFLIAQMLVRHTVSGLPKSTERAAAAWLVAPPDPFRARYHQVGADIAALAAPFAITQTAAALRLNEVIGTDLVIVCENRRPIRRSVRLLGQLPDAELAALAAKRSTKAVRKVRLRDDGKAVALMAV